MRKIKVAIVMPTHFDVHSSLLNFLKTYEYLIKNKNVDVTLFTDRKNSIDYKGLKIEKIDGVDYGTGFDKLFFLLGIPRFYYRNLDEKLKNFDVITSNNPEFYAFAYQAYKSAKKNRKRFVLRTSQSVEGFFLFKLTKSLLCPFMKKAYDYSRFVVFSNPQAEERCLKLGLIDDRRKSIITGHATDVECFKPMKVTKQKNKVLLSVGGLYELKGHHLIIKGLKKIIDGGNKHAELWIVGEGYYKQKLQDLAKDLQVEKQVKFLGAKGHKELAKIYNMADVFVLANYQEITPAVNEALACERPVVVMECGGMEFVIPDDIYGLSCKKFDVDDMAKKINVLLKNKKLAAKIAANGRKRILENFSIEKVADKIYMAYTE